MKIQIGKFLNKRLKEIGIEHIFGVPGDFNLSYLEQVEEDDAIEFVGNCNELNAAYAADGYARIRGFGALVTTYGVGDLSSIGGIAGSYTENIPVVHISGAPPLHAMKNNALLHHTLVDGNYQNVMNCMREFTVAQTLITPANAAYEIDRVLKTGYLERRPVHLQLPSDITHLEIEVEDVPLILQDPTSDTFQLEKAVNVITDMLNHARQPVIMVDIEADRFGLTELLIKISNNFQIPVICLPPAKNMMNEHSPYYYGVYAGAASSPEVKQMVENSDCLIGVGLRFTDASTALFTHKIDEEYFVDLKRHDLKIGNRQFPGVMIKELLENISEKNSLRTQVTSVARQPKLLKSNFDNISEDNPITQEVLWSYVESTMKDNDVVFGEVGTSNIALSSLVFPEKLKYISQPIWGAIGYTVPALFGSLIADKNRRQFLFIGDGSIQLTAQEISSIVRYKLKPVIFVLNNYGYTIERFILGLKFAYNDVHNWQYTKLLDVFDEKGDYQTHIVKNLKDLKDAFRIIENNKLTLIEVQLDPLDAPEKLKIFANAFAKYDYGERFDELRVD